MKLLEPLFRWESVETWLSDRARVQAMLDFEAALARAEAQTGVIPASAAPAIGAKCQASLIDFDSLTRSAASAGNLAIPLVKQLTSLVGSENQEAMRFVHWGATSQDAIDTGFVLQLRAVLSVIDAELGRLSEILATLAEKHRATVVAGRTWLQQAPPTTFGARAAGWLDAIGRHRERLAETRTRAEVLQFGGAVGTLASLGANGMDVARALGEELQLAVPAIPWHGHRDRIAEVATTLSLCAGTMGKIARDLSLQMQTEIGELFESAGEGRGGSSTLPHKRNPVTCSVVLAAAARVPGLVSSLLVAMPQEQERGLGGWQVEWEVLPEIISLVGGALHHLTEMMSALEVDTEKMKANLEVTHGLIFAEAVQMALGASIGRMAAHELVGGACRHAMAEKRHLRDILSEDATVQKHLTSADLNRLFDPAQYLGVADSFVDRVLKAHLSRQPKPGS
jgi:3-carboxy-cis,cis-muconate cycloisomerase